MLRRLIDWLLYTFGFKKREKKSAIGSLLDLLPLVVAAAVIRGAFRYMELEPTRLSLRQRLYRWLRRATWRLRIKLIGY